MGGEGARNKIRFAGGDVLAQQQTALVCGAGGFIGATVKKLKLEGYWVRGVDLKHPDFSPTVADDFVIGDLREQRVWLGETL